MTSQGQKAWQLKDAWLPLITDAFKETVLEGGLILQLVVNTTALDDISLPLITDAFKGTVLEGGLIIKSVVSGKLKDSKSTTYHGHFQRNRA